MWEDVLVEENKEKISSVNEYNKYIKVIKPGAWIVIVAIVSLILCGVLWAFFGNIVMTQSLKSVAYGDLAYGYLDMDSVQNVDAGQRVSVTVDGNILDGVVESIGTTPVNAAQASETLQSEVLAQNIVPEGGGYEVVARLNTSAEVQTGVIADMQIVTLDVAPIQILMHK